ncbi:unnamed protein product, partial [Staurois parvus]
MYTDHQGTDDQCALMISVAPEVPPVSVHQCQQSVPRASAHQCHITVPPHQCPSAPPISVHQYSLSVPIT